MWRSAVAIAALGLLATAPVASAQARVEVSPVGVDLTATKPISSLRLRNTASTPAAFDVKAYVWTQTNGQDVLTPAADLIVSPPAFVIAPGGEQIVRVASLVKGAPPVENAYRILFSEAPLQGVASETGLRLRLQLSLPVFLAPASRGGPPKPHVEYVSTGKNRLVRIENPSAAHLVLTDGAFGTEKLSLPRYLLAGSSMERPAPAAGALALSFLDPDAQEISHSEYAPAPSITNGR